MKSAPQVTVSDVWAELRACVSPGTITEAQLDALAEVAPANPKLPHNPPQVGPMLGSSKPTPAVATPEERAFWLRRYEVALAHPSTDDRHFGKWADADLARLRAQLAARPWLTVSGITAIKADTLACDSPDTELPSPNPAKPHEHGI